MAYNSKTNSRKINVDNIVVDGVIAIMERVSDRVWIGTMTELQTALVRVLGRKRSENLPGSPGALRIVINRVANRIRNRSVGVRFGRTSDHSRTRYVKFAR